MNPFELIFVPGGRVSRLPYFLGILGLVAVFCLVVLMAFVFALGAGTVSRTALSGSMLGAILITFVFFCAYMYGIVNLAVKRLHDLGMSGLHVIWIYGLSFIGTGLGEIDSALTALLGLLVQVFVLCVGLYLLFAPGNDGYNEYG